jgi:hypothetical protein
MFQKWLEYLLNLAFLARRRIIRIFVGQKAIKFTKRVVSCQIRNFLRKTSPDSIANSKKKSQTKFFSKISTLRFTLFWIFQKKNQKRVTFTNCAAKKKQEI